MKIGSHGRRLAPELALPRMPALFSLGPLAAIATAMSEPQEDGRGRAGRRARRSALCDHTGRNDCSGDGRERLRQRLYELTIPNLSLETEFAVVRKRLLEDFPSVVEVFAMRTPGTLLIVYRGADTIDAWCEALGDAVAARRCARSTSETRAEPGRVAFALKALQSAG